MKRLSLRILTAAGFVLLAVVWLWFLPVLLPDLLSGRRDLQRIRRQRAEMFRQRFGFEKWARQENETRHKRIWKNRNDFYK